jgi:hypothetical protein
MRVRKTPFNTCERRKGKCALCSLYASTRIAYMYKAIAEDLLSTTGILLPDFLDRMEH